MSVALPQALELAIARVACGGTIVCHLCNASDVTDDDHRNGCAVHDLRRVIAFYLDHPELHKAADTTEAG